MAIKIEIIKTESGWNYRNSESRKLVGTVNPIPKGSPGIYYWECPENFGFTYQEEAHDELQKELGKHASLLGLEIEFIIP